MKKRLYMRRARPPEWWPQEWVGVLRGGDAWVAGDGDLLTPKQIEAAKEVMRGDYPRARFKVE